MIFVTQRDDIRIEAIMDYIVSIIFSVLGFAGAVTVLPFFVHLIIEMRVAKKIEQLKENPVTPFVIPERHPDGTIDYHVYLREGIVVFRFREESEAEDPYEPEVVSVSDNISCKNGGK